MRGEKQSREKTKLKGQESTFSVSNNGVSLISIYIMNHFKLHYKALTNFVLSFKTFDESFLHPEQMMSGQILDTVDLMSVTISTYPIESYDEQKNFLKSFKSQIIHDSLMTREEENFDPFADGEIDENFGDNIAKIISSLEDDEENGLDVLQCRTDFFLSSQALKDSSSDKENRLDKNDVGSNSKIRESEISEKSRIEIKEDIQNSSMKKTRRQHVIKLSFYDTIKINLNSQSFLPFVKMCSINVVKLPKTYEKMFAIFPLSELNRQNRKRKKKEDLNKESSKRIKTKTTKSKSNRTQTKVNKKQTIPKKSSTITTKIKTAQVESSSKNHLVKGIDTSTKQVGKPQPKLTQKSKPPREKRSQNRQCKSTVKANKIKEKKTEPTEVKKKTISKDFQVSPTSPKSNKSKKPRINCKSESSSAYDKKHVTENLYKVISDLSLVPSRSILKKGKKSERSKKKVSFHNEISIKRYERDNDDYDS